MKDKQLKELGQRVRRRREALDMTRLALCEAADITRTTLRHLENGTQHPSPRTLANVATALGVTEDWLLGVELLQTDDARLKDLNDEDLQVAQLFHHAPMRTKQRAFAVLTDRGRVPASTGPAVDVARRIEQLDLDDRHVVLAMVDSLEKNKDAPATPTAPAPATAADTKVNRRGGER